MEHLKQGSFNSLLMLFIQNSYYGPDAAALCHKILIFDGLSCVLLFCNETSTTTQCNRW